MSHAKDKVSTVEVLHERVKQAWKWNRKRRGGPAPHMDWVDAVWVLRERAMDAREQERAEYVRRYRPIQTLKGLDPYPGYVAFNRFERINNQFARIIARRG